MTTNRIGNYLKSATAATTLIIGSLLNYDCSLLPSKHHELSQENLARYVWNEPIRSTCYSILSENRSDIEKAEIIIGFAQRLIAESQALDTDFGRILKEDFWNLI